MDDIVTVIYGMYYADFSKNGLVFGVSENFTKISGYSIDDIEKNKITIFDFIPDDRVDGYIEMVNDANKNGKSLFIQHPFLKKNGTMIYVLCFGIHVDDTAEHSDIVQVIITDYTEHFELLSKYNSSKLELDTLTSSVPGGVALVSVEDNKINVIKYNDELSRMFEIEESKDKLYFNEFLNSNDASLLVNRFINAEKSGKIVDFEFSVRLKNDSVRWFRLDGKMYKYSHNIPVFYAVIIDISRDKKLNSDLIMQTERFKIIAENTDEIYFDYDVFEDKLILTNSLNRYGLDEDNTIYNYWKDERPKEFVLPEDYDDFKNQWLKILKAPQIGSFEFRTNAYDDDYTWYKMPYVSVANEQNRVARVFGKMMNIQHIKSLKNKIDNDSEYINYLLETDNVTGLLNRKAFKKKAQRLIQMMDKKCVYAMVYSDINDFSYVNDNFGYDAGNGMLRDFGRIISNLDTNLLGCRLYSDYYIGLYKSSSREELIKSIEARNEQFTMSQKKAYPASDLHVSCGIYFIPDGDTDVTIAIDNANLARRSVKSNKGIPYGIYAQRMRTQRAYEQSIASELHSAIENRQVEMFLQPKFSMSDRTIIGAEALARWRNKDGTLKMPYEFIPVLEKVGYIDELDFFIYEEVLKALESWKKNGCYIVPVSVNFSQHHVNQNGFVERIIEVAKKYDVDTSYIEIEITESCFAGDMQSLFSDMEKLRSNGFKIDIDDFGIGYSTLSVLMNAPVDIVKIDKSFIDNLETNKLEREYLNNMCKLIDTVKKDIIFEGVESEEQASILCESGYTKAQGWLFDRAIPLDEFNEKYMGI